MSNHLFEVQNRRTTVTVPHLGGKLSFAWPAKGPAFYYLVMKEIDDDNLPSQLHRPTAAENISLVYALLKDNSSEHSRNLFDRLSFGYLWCFTKAFWTPYGVYVADDISKTDDLSQLKLEELIRANDRRVRFAPYGFEEGLQSGKGLENNSLLIAYAGEEGAQKVAELAAERGKPFIFCSGNPKYEMRNIILGLEHDGSGRISFGGNFFLPGSGYALGVESAGGR